MFTANLVRVFHPETGKKNIHHLVKKTFYIWNILNLAVHHTLVTFLF